MKYMLSILILAACAANAMVKPLSEPWLKAGETLVCYGDSITDWEPGYITILREELAKKGVKVVNAGHGGDNTITALLRLKDVAALKPDAVMIFFGTNDSAAGRGRWRDEPSIEPETYRDNMLWMIHYLRKHAGVQKFSIIPTAGRIEGQGYLEFGKRRDLYNLMARDAADKANAVFVPLDIVFDEARTTKQPGANGLQFTRDTVHLHPEGCALAAATMLQTWKMK